MRLILVLMLFWGPVASSQDLSGIWRGSFVSTEKGITNLFNLEERYKYEVQIDQRSKQFKGVTYSYKTTVFYGKAAADGTVNPKTGKVMLNELRLLELKMSPDSYACWMVCMLQYTKNGEEEFLEGKFSSYRESDSSFCGRGTVFLRKVASSDFYKEPFVIKRELEKQKAVERALAKKKVTTPLNKTTTAKTSAATTKPPVKKPVTTPPVAKKTTPAVTQPPVAKKDPKSAPVTAPVETEKKSPVVKTTFPTIIPPVLKNRSNEVVETLVVNTNEITVNLYDNGTIDHDTVSVYLDKKLVLSRQMLTTVPLSLKLKMDEANDYHELVMVAENLGDIPPNTSLMVVKAGDKTFEVRITSTEQKNAMVIFKYEKK
ncbi:MAG: hypothetical protein H7Y27_04140 [Gemmatimonadaceae bacterium]|nr:hypothetical protein [Chitinophagaceae bacterium]